MLDVERILIVDDSRLMREVLSTMLAPQCEKVLTASDCREAIEVVAGNSDLDLVICDVGLPDGSGLAVLERISAAPGPRPDVILITATWTPEERVYEREFPWILLFPHLPCAPSRPARVRHTNPVVPG